MNWYKKAGYKNFPTWFADQLQNLPPNNKEIISANFDKILNWVEETYPNLDKISIMEAYSKALDHERNKRYQSESDKVRFTHNKFIAESQNINPNEPNFAVDLRLGTRPIPPNSRKKINDAIHDLGNFHESIPLDEIFSICEANGVVVLQEDGTKWSGMLMGGAECGSEKARNQFALFDLAVKNDHGEYVPSSHAMNLSWCKMGNALRSDKYEIVCYVN